MYVKLFASIYQGTLRGNSHGLLVFTNMLAHTNKDGVVDIHPRAIAEEVGLTIEQVRTALDVLESPDDESRSPEEQGRRILRLDEHRAWGWQVVNYGKYRAIRSEEDRREQNRVAQKNFRSKQSKPASAEGQPSKPIQRHKAEAEATAEAKSKEEKAPTAPARKRATPPPVKPEDVAEQTWTDWLTLRKAKKAPVTATVIAEAVREAEKAGMPIESFLAEWCARGSQGLKAEWMAGKNGAPRNRQLEIEAENKRVAAQWLQGTQR